MLSKEEIKYIMKTLKFNTVEINNFNRTFNYDIFEAIITIDEKGPHFTEKEWNKFVDKYKDNSLILSEASFSPHFPKSVLLNVVKNLKILDDCNEVSCFDKVNEENILRNFFKSDFDEKEYSEIINKILPENLSNVFTCFSKPNFNKKEDMEAFLKAHKFNQTALKLACKKAMENHIALKPGSINDVHNLDELMVIDDIDFLKDMVNKHFREKYKQEALKQSSENYGIRINDFRELIPSVSRIALINNPHLDVNDPDHLDLLCKVFYNENGYQYMPKTNKFATIMLTSRPIPYVIENSINSFIEDFDELNAATPCIEKLLICNAIPEELQIKLYNKTLKEYQSTENSDSEIEALLKVLFVFSKVDVIIDGIQFLPFDFQTDILARRNNIPIDILKSYFDRFMKLNETVRETVTDPLTLRVLEKGLTKITFSNKIYDDFFKHVDKKRTSLSSLLLKPNAIPDNYLMKIIQEQHKIYLDVYDKYKDHEPIMQKRTKHKYAIESLHYSICAAILLCSRQLNLPDCVFNEIRSALAHARIQLTTENYINDMKFSYDTVSFIPPTYIAQMIKQLNIKNKEELVDIFKKISNDLKDIFAKATPDIVLPQEMAFADFIVEHISNMYDINELIQCRIKYEPELLRNRSTDDLSKVYESFNCMISEDWPEIDESFSDGMSLYAERCRDFNREGRYFIDVVNIMKEERDKMVKEMQEKNKEEVSL